MELVILGSAGWVPQATRMTTAVAARIGETLLLFDAGSGLARLREPQYRLLLPVDGPVHLLLSHLHLDHTVGLSYLPALWRNPTTVYVPQVEVPGGGEVGSGVLERLIGPPFFPRGLARFPMPLILRPLREGVVEVECGLEQPVSVRVREQPHPGGSFGFRLGDAAAFLTDSAASDDAAAFVAGVRVLVHEAWSIGDRETEEGGLRAGRDAHSSALEAARVARDAGVGELLLCHLSPLVDEAHYSAMLERAREVFAQTYLCEDGLRRVISGPSAPGGA